MQVICIILIYQYFKIFLLSTVWQKKVSLHAMFLLMCFFNLIFYFLLACREKKTLEENLKKKSKKGEAIKNNLLNSGRAKHNLHEY